MAYRIFHAIVIAVLMSLSPLATADNSVISGLFDGSESKTAGLPAACPGAGELAYVAIDSLQVSVSGSYTVTNFYYKGEAVSTYVYQGKFNPDAPGDSLLQSIGVDSGALVELSAGTDYTVVVQQWCENTEGAWAVTFSGPGEVNSVATVMVPEWTEGAFAADDPVSDSSCGNTKYQESGPIQLPESGLYYYTDVSIKFDVDVCLQIYTAPFDANNPSANRLAKFVDWGTVELESGRDYYFVVQPEFNIESGEFFYLFAPPAPFRITHSLAGNWFDPLTSGQGFFVDVYDTDNLLFIGWYTFDLQRPAEDTPSFMGDPGHRWLVALGDFSGNSGMLPLYWSTGMIFDSPDPPSNDAVEDGSMTIEFFNCNTGEVRYKIDSVQVEGIIPIVRPNDNAVPMCESLTTGPGMPGPLMP